MNCIGSQSQAAGYGGKKELGCHQDQVEEQRIKGNPQDGGRRS